MKSIYGGIVIVFMFIMVFSSLSLIGQEQNYNNLDPKSKQVLDSIDSGIAQNWNEDNLTESSGFNNTNTEEKSAFGFEFLSAKSSAEKKISIIQTLKNSPDMIIASTGVDSEPFSPFLTAFKWFIGIVLGLILFDAIFTRRVFNK